MASDLKKVRRHRERRLLIAMIGEIGAERRNALGVLRTEVYKRQEHSGVGMRGIEADETGPAVHCLAGLHHHPRALPPLSHLCCHPLSCRAMVRTFEKESALVMVA